MTVKKLEIVPVRQHFKIILIVSQCFGLFPVMGIAKESAKEMVFSWKSKRTIYSLFVIFCLMFVTFSSVLYLIHGQQSLTKWTHLSFYLSNLTANVLFLKLAKAWPKVMQFWEQIEIKIKNSENLTRKFRALCFFVLGCVLVEHSFFEITLTKDLYNRSKNTSHFLQMLVLNENPCLTMFIPNTIYLSVFSKWIQILATFSWTFVDLFIILVSVCLADNFRQIANKIKISQKETTELFWQNMREEYGLLCELYEEIDNSISLITLLSFTSNLYFILNQLFRSISSKESMISNIYFFASFALVVVRLLSVCLFASEIHDESKKPLYHLIFLPSEIYCEEVERLMDQIHIRTIALTGHKLFSVTRKIIFKIAATIVTYELFLFQFNINTLY